MQLVLSGTGELVGPVAGGFAHMPRCHHNPFFDALHMYRGIMSEVSAHAHTPIYKLVTKVSRFHSCMYILSDKS